MGSSERRAKDTDRDLAVDFVEAAWADGQLTREEYDARVDRLLRATSLTELEHEVRDLQGPDGSPWVPGVPVRATPLTPEVVEARRTLSRGEAYRQRREQREKLFLVIGVVIALCTGLALVIWPEGIGQKQQTAVPYVAPPAERTPSALNADGFRALVDTLEASGSTEVFTAHITRQFTRVTVPDRATDASASTYEWAGAELERMSITSSDVPRVDLATIDPVTIERAARATVDSGRGTRAEVILTVEVREWEDQQVCVTGDLSPSRRGEGMRPFEVGYDCTGRRVF